MISASKTFLILISIFAGILVGWRFKSVDSIKSILIGLIVSILYPIIAAGVIGLCEAMKNWAYCGKIKRWTQAKRLSLGALWPITLVFCIIVYSFLGIINRVFRLVF
jgi:hypothetical protein